MVFCFNILIYIFKNVIYVIVKLNILRARKQYNKSMLTSY